MRRYVLADTAVKLSWAPQDVEVIDRDLGLSGTSAAHRQGFRDLMSRVCLGKVGAVLGLEISRLARSNADLAQLAEMARLTGTLLIDSEGATTCRTSTTGSCWACTHRGMSHSEVFSATFS